jgi:hypothetical protein
MTRQTIGRNDHVDIALETPRERAIRGLYARADAGTDQATVSKLDHGSGGAHRPAMAYVVAANAPILRAA